MPLSVYFNCPGCNARIKAPVQFLGTYRNCPGCKIRFIVRSQPRQDAGPLFVKEAATEQTTAR
jgi:hypothetical protein